MTGKAIFLVLAASYRVPGRSGPHRQQIAPDNLCMMECRDLPPHVQRDVAQAISIALRHLHNMPFNARNVTKVLCF
jgi:hypothetical protein